MKIPEILSEFSLTQQEFADFTGIPRGRIAKWIQDEKDPPKAHDIQLIALAVKFFTQMPKEKVKAAVKNYRIILNNIEPIKQYEDTLQTGKHESVVMENVQTYNADKQSVNKKKGAKKDEDIFDVVSLESPNDTSMLNRVLALLEKKEANMTELIAQTSALIAQTGVAIAQTGVATRANEKLAESFLELMKTINHGQYQQDLGKAGGM